MKEPFTKVWAEYARGDDVLHRLRCWGGSAYQSLESHQEGCFAILTFRVMQLDVTL